MSRRAGQLAAAGVSPPLLGASETTSHTPGSAFSRPGATSCSSALWRRMIVRRSFGKLGQPPLEFGGLAAQGALSFSFLGFVRAQKRKPVDPDT